MQPTKEDILNMYRAANSHSAEYYESHKWKEGEATKKHNWRHCPGSMEPGDRILYQLREDEPGEATILHISRKEFPIPTVVNVIYIRKLEE